MREIPLRDGQLVCCGCCQGKTELIIDTVFSDVYKLTLICPECGSNWTLISDEWVKEKCCWRSRLNRDADTKRKETNCDDIEKWASGLANDTKDAND